jgi:hypothetical protein
MVSSPKNARLSSERRRAQRALAQVPARWIRRSGASPLTTADVCVRGMFLCTAEQARIGELLKIEILLADGALPMMVVVRNRGVRGGRQGVGVETYQLTDEDGFRWKRFCRSLGCEMPEDQ